MRARHIQLKMVNFICFWHSHRFAFVATSLSVSHYTHIESHKRWHEKQFQPLITTFTDIKFISNRYSVVHTLTAWTLAALRVHTESDSREIWSTSTSQSTKNKVLSIHVLNLLNDIYYIAAANENHFRQIFVCHFGILSLSLSVECCMTEPRTMDYSSHSDSGTHLVSWWLVSMANRGQKSIGPNKTSASNETKPEMAFCFALFGDHRT